ncbi:MAG: HD domain-containing protein [Candidatus Omnitrophica bacterium]|nr:HD domain-containing protein [Candidatus Omnitrophota bacterium]
MTQRKMLKKFVTELSDNETVDTYFLLVKNVRKLTKNDKPYLELTFQDKTGKIEGRLWDDADVYYGKCETGDVVRVKGIIQSYKESRQVKVDMLEKSAPGSFSREEVVRVAPNREETGKKLAGYLKSFTNTWIRCLAEAFTDDAVFMERFKDGIGAKSWHNAYVGGLLEHTYEVMYMVDKMCDLYPELSRDIAIFGAFIHDIGKIRELDEKRMEYTLEGGLIGHVAIGYVILSEKISRVKDFPEDLRLRLCHIILSHHGEYEQQAPVLPKTLEATVVYQADDLVSQASAVREILVSQKGSDREWSDYVSIKSRKYFVREPLREDAKDKGTGNIVNGKDLFG